MARVTKPRPLSLTVSADANGVPFISNVEFCSAEMSVQWGRSFFGDISLSETQEPAVSVYLGNAIGELVEINKSPFTGGEILVSVDEKSYDDVVAALLAMASPADQDVPQPISEDVDDGYQDEGEAEEDDAGFGEDEDFEDEEDLEDEDDGLEDEEELEDDEEYEDEE